MSTALPRELTHAQAHDCASSLIQALRACPAGGTLELDASALQHFDSSALAVILELRRQAQAAGRAVRVVRAPERLQMLSRLYGVESLVL